MYQLGGIEPLAKVPNFKYTFNESRKLFINTIYPYAEYFLFCVTKIPFNTYYYSGINDVLLFKDPDRDPNKPEVPDEFRSVQFTSKNAPLYFLSGGCAYELLNKKYKNIDLFKYCDATGDIDVALFPPKLVTEKDTEKDMPLGYTLLFLNKDKKINSFYEHFSTWIFNELNKNLLDIKSIIGKISSSIIDFNIIEYKEIPDSNRDKENLGYKCIKIDKFYLVAFLNEEKTMFKIQIVCKIEEKDISVIDHIVEIIIPLPLEGSDEFSPDSELYSLPEINIINISNNNFNLPNYNSLLRDNIEAYISRYQVFNSKNESENIHKPINHIARLLYLYELFYINITEFEKKNFEKFDTLFKLYRNKKQEIQILENLQYYKIINSSFNKIQINSKYFLNCYITIIKKNSSFKLFKNLYPDYFREMSEEGEKQMHDNFIERLFNEDLFVEKDGVLTFVNSGGKINKRKTKNKSKNKPKNKSKNKPKNKSKNKSKKIYK